MMNKHGSKSYLFLHMVLLIYSATSVLSKTASNLNGAGFVLCYGGVLLCLGGYALLWQAVLKKFDLTVAFANKAVVLIWGIIWGWLFFNEAVTWNKVVGAVVIITGILIVVRDND